MQGYFDYSLEKQSEITVFISTAILVVVIWAAYAIWSKLCDIEQKLFRMHDELLLSQKYTEQQIDLLQSALGRIEYGRDFDLDKLID